MMEKQSKHEQMLHYVEKIILEGELKPGDRLPPEREIQEQYGIGRGTLREALRALQQKGLIEIKKGAKGGAFVKEINAEDVSETLAVLIRHSRISLKHLSEFRDIVEPATAGYAAERATSREIDEMKNMLKQGIFLFKSNRDDLAGFYQWELGMHKKLASVSGNPIFEWISGTLYKSMEPLSFHINKNDVSHSSLLEDWQRLISAIENREVMKAPSIVQIHIARYKNFIKEEYKDPDG